MPRRRRSSNTRLNALTAAAVSRTTDLYREAVAATVSSEGEQAAWQEFARSYARAHLLAGLMGSDTVFRSAARAGAELEYGTDPVGPVRFSAAAISAAFEEGSEFVAGPFLDAIRAFEGRVPRLRSVVDQLAKRARRSATAVVGLESGEGVAALAGKSPLLQQIMRGSFFVSDLGEREIESMRSLLVDVLRGRHAGRLDLPEFIDEARFASMDVLSEARLEVIYRNNLHSAYTDGQADALTDPKVMRTIPLAEIDEINDHRTRETHHAVDGYIDTMARIDQFGLRPPNGHNCRATLVPVTFDRALGLGLIDQQGIPIRSAINRYNAARLPLIMSGRYPDPGFGNAA